MCWHLDRFQATHSSLLPLIRDYTPFILDSQKATVDSDEFDCFSASVQIDGTMCILPWTSLKTVITEIHFFTVPLPLFESGGQINNKVLLCSTGNYMQYPVINHHGKEYKKKNLYVSI